NFKAALDDLNAARDIDALVTRAFDMIGREFLNAWTNQTNAREKDLICLRNIIAAYDNVATSLGAIEARFVPRINLNGILSLKNGDDSSDYVLCSKRLWSSIRRFTEEEWQILIQRYLSRE